MPFFADWLAYALISMKNPIDKKMIELVKQVGKWNPKDPIGWKYKLELFLHKRCPLEAIVGPVTIPGNSFCLKRTLEFH